MLFTRIAADEKVQVLDRETVEEACSGVATDLNHKSVLKLGKKIQADYTVYESLTKIGNYISMDGIFVDIKKEETTARLSFSSKGMDGVIPKANEFAQAIKRRSFGEG